MRRCSDVLHYREEVLLEVYLGGKVLSDEEVYHQEEEEVGRSLLRR